MTPTDLGLRPATAHLVRGAGHALGRHAAPDQRDARFPMRTVIDAARDAGAVTASTYRYWPSEVWLDQNPLPECVAYAWTHYLVDSPIVHGAGAKGIAWLEAEEQRVKAAPLAWPGGKAHNAGADTGYLAAATRWPDALYERAQDLDEWQGSDYDGTSVRAGARALQEAGLIGAYHAATNAADVIDAILTVGPVVLGITWYASDFDPTTTPDAQGRRYLLTGQGDVAGGHAIKADGANRNRGFIRIKNNWGRAWGNHGYAYMTFDELDRRLADQGEAYITADLAAAP